MKEMHILILTALTVGLNVYPVTLKLQEHDSNLPQTTPEATVRKFMEALDHAEWNNWISTMDEECTMYIPFLSRMAENRTEIEKVFQGIFDRLNSSSDRRALFFNFKPKDMMIRDLSDDVSVVTWHLEQEGESVGRRSAVVKKTQGEWTIIHFHADRFKLN